MYFIVGLAVREGAPPDGFGRYLRANVAAKLPASNVEALSPGVGDCDRLLDEAELHGDGVSSDFGGGGAAGSSAVGAAAISSKVNKR